MSAVFGGATIRTSTRRTNSAANPTSPMGAPCGRTHHRRAHRERRREDVRAIPSDLLLFDERRRHLRPRLRRRHGRQAVRLSDKLHDDEAVQHAERTANFLPARRRHQNGSVMVSFGTGDHSSPMSTCFTDRFTRCATTARTTAGERSRERHEPGRSRAARYDDLLEEIGDAHKMVPRARRRRTVSSPPTVYFNIAFSTFPSNAVCQAGGTARVVVDPLVGGSGRPTLPTPRAVGLSAAAARPAAASGRSRALIHFTDRYVSVGQSIPTSLKVTFGDNETKAFSA